jgi:hypothetical protein
MVLESLCVNGLQSGNRGVGFVGMDLGRDQRVSTKSGENRDRQPRAKWEAASAYLRIHQDDSIIEIRFPESRIELDGDFQLACKGVLLKARMHTQELFRGKEYRLRLRGFLTVYTVLDETGLHSPLSSVVDRKLVCARLDSGRHFKVRGSRAFHTDDRGYYFGLECG